LAKSAPSFSEHSGSNAPQRCGDSFDAAKIPHSFGECAHAQKKAEVAGRFAFFQKYFK